MFTDRELEYLGGQRLGRIATVGADGQPRMIEVRGTAAVIPAGGKAFGERFEDTIVRIRPTRIVAFVSTLAIRPTRGRSAQPDPADFAVADLPGGR